LIRRNGTSPISGRRGAVIDDASPGWPYRCWWSAAVTTCWALRAGPPLRRAGSRPWHVDLAGAHVSWDISPHGGSRSAFVAVAV